MRLLLDTHAWLWATTERDRLSAEAIALLEDTENEALVSAASAHEIAIKWSLGKLRLPEPPASWVPAVVARRGYGVLPIELRHALRVSTLPKHHADPFDRVLIAQALEEDLPILTADPAIRRYEVRVIGAER